NRIPATDITLVRKEKNTRTSIKIYPNPFRSQSNIVLNLEEDKEVEIYLYDLAGRLVKTVLPRQICTANTHRFDINGETLESGFYLLAIRIGKEWENRKIALLR
ncbi:MAG: T9SS type A sorting domain-containing protein, partial [Bacteroidota bacterium]